jgi:hypothetical protein
MWGQGRYIVLGSGEILAWRQNRHDRYTGGKSLCGSVW